MVFSHFAIALFFPIPVCWGMNTTGCNEGHCWDMNKSLSVNIDCRKMVLLLSSTADIGYGVIVAGAAAAAEVPVHSRRAASEPTRSADDIGRRPEVSAGVGPTVNMYSGKARKPHFAGITAHDGGSRVLNPSFRGQPHVIPPVFKGGNDFQTFRHDFLLNANMLDISDHFVGQRVRTVPVRDPLKQKAVPLREVFLREEIRDRLSVKNTKTGSVNDSCSSSSSSDSSNSKDNSTSRRNSDSNASHTSNGSSSTSGSVSNGDTPALTGTEARRLPHFGQAPRTTERTHEVPITGLGFELVLYRCSAGVCKKGG